MKSLKIMLVPLLIAASVLVWRSQSAATACQSSRCIITNPTLTCNRSMVLAKAVPGVFVAPVAAPATISLPANLFITCQDPSTSPQGCAATALGPPCNNTVTSASLTISILLPLTAAGTISTTAGTMMPAPMCSTPVPGGPSVPGVFNPYSVPVVIPAGTPAGLYPVTGGATVTYADGTTITATGDTVLCLVRESPTQPGRPRLDVELLTPPFLRMAPGDQALPQYRITNRDQTPVTNLTLFADAQQVALRPRGANETTGIYAISNPFGDDFPLAFDPETCIPLPDHPFTQPGITRGGLTLAPGQSITVRVGMRSYGQCASGSCNESFLRVEGTFMGESTPTRACASMALYVDTTVPSTACGMLNNENDCNRNGVPDADDIARRTSQDRNFNALPDECEPRQLIIPNMAQITPAIAAPGATLRVNVRVVSQFPVASVLANGRPLVDEGGGNWTGQLPAERSVGPQTVYLLAKDAPPQNMPSLLAATIGVYETRIEQTLATVPAASFRREELALDSIAAAFGANLAPRTELATTLPLPTVLADTRVLVLDGAGNERPAPLFFVSASQINLALPPGTAAGPALLRVTNTDGSLTRAQGTVNLLPIAPGLFAANANGQGVAAAVALRVRGGVQTSEPVFDRATNPRVAVPIDLGPAGDQVFLIGFGSGFRLARAVTCIIGGVNAPVQFAGAAPGFVGLDQVNILLPRALAGRGEVNVVLSAAGKESNTVQINIR